MASVEIRYEEQLLSRDRFLGIFWRCTDIMPGDLCDDLDLPRGSTYAQAAQGLRAEYRAAALTQA